MAADASLALQTGIYTQLAAAAGLANITVYDNVPADASMPFIRFCSTLLNENWNTSTTKGQNVSAQFDVYSESLAGKTECMTWLTALSTALTATDVSLTGWTLIRAVVLRTTVLDESTPERHLYHGILEMLYHLQEG